VYCWRGTSLHPLWRTVPCVRGISARAGGYRQVTKEGRYLLSAWHQLLLQGEPRILGTPLKALREGGLKPRVSYVPPNRVRGGKG